jgi:hypothetical protein
VTPSGLADVIHWRLDLERIRADASELLPEEGIEELEEMLKEDA